MGKIASIEFYQTEEDESEFIRFLESTGDIAVWSAYSVAEIHDLSPLPLSSLLDRFKDTHVVNIGPLNLAGMIKIKKTDPHISPGFSVGYFESCVLQYTRPSIVRGPLSSSDIAGYWWQFPEPQDGHLTKPDSFIHWGKRVMNWARRFSNERVLVDDYPRRVTRRVKAVSCQKSGARVWGARRSRREKMLRRFPSLCDPVKLPRAR